MYVANPLLSESTPGASNCSRNYARAATLEATTTQGFASHLEETSLASAKITTPTSAAPAPSPVATTTSETETDKLLGEGDAAYPDVVVSSLTEAQSGANGVEEVEDASFSDFVDFINPLQHIPVLSSLYRNLTGDSIRPSVRVAGDLAFGALTGSIILSGAISIASTAFEQSTGKDPVTQIASALFGDEEETKLAEAAPSGAGQAEGTQTATAAPKAQEAPKTERVEGPVKLAAAAPVVDPAAIPSSTNPTVTAAVPAGTAVPTTMADRQMAAATVQGTRIGHTIYTSPLMNRAARVSNAAALRDATKATAQKTALPSAGGTLSAEQKTALGTQGKITAAKAIGVPGGESDSKTLGDLMKKSADASAAGGKLPSDLVQDMMMMALDKYKAAGRLAPSEINLDGTSIN